MDEGSYVLRDRDAEEMFDMNVATSLARAKSKKLLMVSIVMYNLILLFTAF